ncbi:MAG: TonB-dependent receptor [Mediterranea sp.]|jgi:TonB-linked SusC/RagA family outer membrane protein|nr:TonB-dependent receptor [Mediterranea sp.]
MNSKKKKAVIAAAALLATGLLQVPLTAYAESSVHLSSASISQQTNRVRGTVVDATTGDPIIGANVIVKGSGTGTITNIDGEFTLEAATGTTLEISYIGYVTQEVRASGSVMSIRLKEDAQALSEVVVVGYSTQRRESLTGALQTLKSDELLSTTSASVENLLSGKAPGVYVVPGDGSPDSKGNVIIRGNTSINGNADPLWVVDGVIVGSRSNNSLNPNDIETMTILKDAASTAIYGSQGANGVVVVTTKRAKSDKVGINASAKFGVSTLTNGKQQMMNGAELYDYYKSFSNAEAISFPRWNEQLRNDNFDWWKLATHTGLVQDYNVSLTGGSNNMKTFFSVGYYNEDGAIRGYDYNRYNARFRMEYKLWDRLTIKPMLSGSRKDIRDASYSVTAMYSNLPWDSPYMPDGTLTPHRPSTWVNSASTNYLLDLSYGNYGESRTYSFMGNFDFDVRITDWLTFSSVNNFTYDGYSYHGYTDPRSSGGESVNGRVTENNSRTERRYTNQLLRYNQAFGKHAVNAIFGYEFSDYDYKYTNSQGTSMISGFESLDVTAVPEVAKGYTNTSAMQSIIFNANYAYDDKYLAQVSFRRDGASNFGENAKYGNFFSVSGGWLLNKENFLSDAKWLDLLKVRASYGSTGNRPSSLYPHMDLYSLTGIKYNDNFGALISQIGNKDLTWEKTYTTGIGVDFNFLKRFRLSLDYYNKYTSNILLQQPVSGLTGVTSVWKNIGEMSNQGIELTIGADIITTSDWNWSISGNLGYNQNEVKKLYAQRKADGTMEETPKILPSFYNIAGTMSRILTPGESATSYYGREWAGVNPETGAPQWYKTDTDGKRVLTENYTEADQVILGDYSPKVFGGFQTDLRWKRFDLSAQFGYSLGGKIYNYSRQEYDSDGTYTDRNQMKLKKGWTRWEKAGDIATHPKASYNNQSKANQVSSRYIESGDYLKLRTLTIGYNFDLSKHNIQTLRLSFTAENLLTLTGYSGVDPEIPTSGDNRLVSGTAGPGVRPTARKFMFGLNFSF